MSSQTTPISPTRFASALSDLPIDSIYAKHAELRNSIAHMQSSNKQLEDYARDNDDRECYEAVLENRLVIKRFEERIDLLRREVVEVRGLPWKPREEEGEAEGGDGRAVREGGNGGEGGVITNGHGSQEQRNGDDAVGQNGGEEDGVFL
jgi:hypothetical protein